MPERSVEQDVGMLVSVMAENSPCFVFSGSPKTVGSAQKSVGRSESSVGGTALFVHLMTELSWTRRAHPICERRRRSTTLPSPPKDSEQPTDFRFVPKPRRASQRRGTRGIYWAGL